MERTCAQRRPRPRERDGGVVVVVAFLMLLAIAGGLFTLYRYSWLPILEEERQADHMQVVERQMERLLVSIDDLTRQRDDRTLLVSIPLGLRGSGVPPRSELPHELLLQNRTQAIAEVSGGSPTSGPGGIGLSTGAILILEENGQDLTGLDEGFQAIAAGEVLTGVSDITDFRVKLDTVNANYNGDNVTLIVRDKDGDFVGRFVVYIEKEGSEYDIFVRAVNSTGHTLYDLGEAFAGSTTLSPYWVNVMDPLYRFNRVLIAAEEPLTVELIENNGGGNQNERNTALQGSYSISYQEQQAGGEGAVPRQDGGGKSKASHTQQYRTDYLAYRGVNPEYEDQTLWVEMGGVIIEQDGGAAFRTRPFVNADRVGANISLELRFPALNVTPGSFAGVGPVTVRLQQTNHTSLYAWAEQPVLNLTTPFPGVWADHFAVRLDLGGVPASWYSITQGSDWVRLQLDGNQAVSQPYHALLRIDHGTIRVGVDA